MTGVQLIAKERKRQMSKEGWTAEHDDQHAKEELADAALCYIDKGITFPIDDVWPWDRKWWKPTTRIVDLVKAGALIAAEIDRLQRKAKKKG